MRAPPFAGPTGFVEGNCDDTAHLYPRAGQGPGAQTETRENLGSTVIYDALRSGEIDVYIDYTGTLWANAMGQDTPIERNLMNARVTAWLAQEAGILSLGRVGFENAYGFAVSQSFAEDNDLTSIADLDQLDRLSVGADPEFFVRPEWERTQALYGLAGAEQRSMDATFMYGAVRDGALRP